MKETNMSKKNEDDDVFKLMKMVHFYEAFMFYFFLNETYGKNKDTDARTVVLKAIEFGEKVIGKSIDDLYQEQDIVSKPDFFEKIDQTFFNSNKKDGEIVH
jgi:hypothetical protein